MNIVAQTRAAQVAVEAAVYHAAQTKLMKGGATGLDIDPYDPITSLRKYIEAKRMNLEAQVIRALAPGVYSEE